jgi:hypothetical protein
VKVLELEELVAVVMPLFLVEQQLLEQPILVAVVGLFMLALAALAVQALSFFATPAQFNISLVAQSVWLTTMSFTNLHLQAHWLLLHLL